MAKEAQNDTVFREEQNHLDSTKAAIQSLLDGYEQKVHKGEKELSSGNRYNDKEDRSFLQNVRSNICENSSRVAFYKRIIPRPYFGRIDVTENNDKAETETYYIGNDAVLDEDADVLVLSWKDPMGSIFYANAQNSIQVKDTTFQLLLRRALEIQNGTLLGYHTEYDAESSDSLNGEIVDSFLLTVLKDKRRQKQLTNIIRTIQANQNKIIRKPQSDNLVVQGCAGSGKTMILLHRLSVLAYNNREWDLSRVKIITPNRTFNMHINALSEELGLGNIERCSVEEYYISLIHQFNKAVETGTEVHSEMLLDNKFLEEVYSLDFMDKIHLDYEKYWQSMIQELQAKRFAELCEICGVESPVLSIYKNATVEALKRTIERAKERAKQQNQTVENLQARIAEINKKLNSNQNSTASLNAVLAKRRSLAGEAIQRNIHAIDAQIEKQKNLPIESEKSQKLRKDIADIQRLKEKVERAQKEIDDKVEQYLDYDEIHTLSDAFAAQIIGQNQKVEAAIQAAQVALNHVPFYNFAKRNALKADIAQLKEKFTAQAQAYIEAYKASRMDAIKTATVKQAELEKALTAELQRAGENKKAIADLQHRRDVLLLQQKALPLTNYAAWCNAVGNNFEVGEVKDYDKALSEYADAEKSIVSLRETLQMREAELQQSEAQSLNEVQLRDLVDCANLAKQLEWQSIINNVLNKDLADLHIKYGVSRRVTNYRFKLYLRLLCCALYYRPIAKPDNFLCVDEAQDISVAEYRLLRSILGERCVFNLYGDINQKIYPYKGVSMWDDIADITGVHDILSEADMLLDDTTHVCLLNENYRNTLQITEFCNKEFEANVTAVGIAGDPVQEMQLAAAVQWLWSLKHKNKELRVAVVYKPGSKDFHAQMDALPQTTTACWDTVDTDKMCILPVELVKGLEFDAVVAVIDRMSFNEKYVTFTRALDYLSVVRETFRADDAEDKDSGKKPSDSPAAQAKHSAKAPAEETIAVEPVQGANPEEKSSPEAQPNQAENTSRESTKTDAFYVWLAAQVPEEQLPQMREMLDSVSEFCKKTRLWDKPITEASNAEFVRRMKKHIRSNRVFLTANRMRMPLIFKAMDMLAKYCDLPPVEQKPVQEPEAKPETSAAAAESVLTPEIPMEKPQNELMQLLPQEELQPLLQAMAADGVTTKKAFATAMVVGYINRCGYATRRRIFIWDAVKPVWNAWRRGDSGEEELARVSEVLQREIVSTTTGKPQAVSVLPSTSRTVTVGEKGTQQEIATAENCAGRTPCAMVICGQKYPVDSWRNVLVTVCNYFLIHCPDKMQGYADKPLTMRSDEPLFGKNMMGESLLHGYRVNTTQSAKDVLRIGKTLCGLCEVPIDGFVVYLTPEANAAAPSQETEASHTQQSHKVTQTSAPVPNAAPRTSPSAISFAGSRVPTSVFICNNTYPVRTWGEVLEVVCNRFFSLYPNKMAALADRPLTGMGSAPVFGRKVGGNVLANGYHVDVQQSPQQIGEICRVLAERCGADKEAIRINFPNPVSVASNTGSAQAREPVQQAPMRQTLSDETKARIADYVKKKELTGASLIELTNFTHLSRDEISRYMDSDTAYIEITRELYLHRDCIYDLDDIVEPLENILQKQFRHFYGFTMDKKLKEGADQELGMFINDYDFHTKEEIYGLAKYLFGKCKVNGIEHGFNGNGYIWEKPTKAESNRTAVIINLARRYEDPVLTREEITTQFELLGFFVTMYKQAMDLGPDSPFLQYDTDKFVLAERMKMDTAWAAQVGDALDHLMVAAQSDYVVLRAIREDWYSANLPVLPEGVRWTALLLQEVVEHFLQGRYRTVHQYSGLSSDSLCAAIAKEDSPLVTFPDIVYNYVECSALEKADFACEEFRQKLVQAGMLQGAELRTTLPKALDDHRFAWDTAKENLHIVGV